MILVTLGTQDKQFERILKVVDKAIEDGYIKDEVIAQTGYTRYSSPRMKCFDFIPDKELDKLVDKSELIITHGGVGSITSALKKGKKVFAMARLECFKEHKNDHQVQIVNKFEELGYIKRITTYEDFIKDYKNLDKFKPKKPRFGNTKILDIVEEFIG